ncbi:MAG: asparaginase [Lachnospiraceae bacterium]|nr:asparaginase [Lachnospiraceae bacterium]
MSNILVILTGGTIGSSEENNYISVASDSKKYKIIELFKEKNPGLSKDIIFETCEPYTILSENLSGKYINNLINCVKENIIRSYDGIIITHGTDTLQYTAAALGIIFKTVKIPVILVSSNYILEDERANGLDNFSLAVKYIKDKCASGIYVSYDGKMTGGLTLLPHMAYSDKLYRIDNPDTDFDFIDIDRTKNTLSDISPVLYLKAVPGQYYPDLEITHPKAILFETYHSGTLCTDSEAFQNFCKSADSLNIPVYVVGVEERIQYESTSAYEELHLKVLGKISPVTAYMMLWIKYS